MNYENAGTLNAESILENITRTLLYEGYALYPYHRSAIKNQKPIPFGVVFPQRYNIYNAHAHSKMQTQCIVTGSDDLTINISMRFLHLKKTELFEKVPAHEAVEDNFIPVYNLNISDKFYQAGWQTAERKINTGDLQISQLIKNKKVIPVEFDEMYDSKYFYDKSGKAAKQINSISGIKGSVIIEAAPAGNMQNTFRLTVTVINTTPVENAEQVTRDEVLSQSFLSTHTVLQTRNAVFISHQNPGEKWEETISGCENINTWPILIDESNTTLLSSPIILYDYPRINPQSLGDLFDSTEIEEALLLHVAVLSDEEKQQIARGDEKLQAMLTRVSQVTPKEMINFHSGLKNSTQDQINMQKKSEL
ncbi:MAG: hypothetical protein ABI863_15550 [Ginsengibacter sp.]